MNGLFFLILIFSLPLVNFGQEKTTKGFYNDSWEACDSVSAKYVSYKYSLDSIPLRGIEKIFSKDNILISEIEYSDLKSQVREGVIKQYYPEGKLLSLSEYKNGKIHGDFKAFYISGKIKRTDKYENDKLILGKCFTEAGLDTTFYTFEEFPRYPGGERAMFGFVHNNLRYPMEAAENGIMGNVIIGFTINKEGTIVNIHLKKSVNPLLDSEALRIIRLMGKWKPGRKNGDLIDVNFSVPINFILQ